MGQAWYGVPATTAGNVALIHQAGDANVDAIAAAADSSASPVGQTQTVDPKFVQKLVEEAAAQVYEDVHLQLKNIQETSLHQTQQMAKELQTKLQPLSRVSQKDNAVCASSRSVLLRCLQEHAQPHGALLCDDAVNAYHVCSLSDS